MSNISSETPRSFGRNPARSSIEVNGVANAAAVALGLHDEGHSFELPARLFEQLSSFLTSDLHETSYQSAADALHLPLSAIKTTVHRMRRDYRARLLEEIGRTVSSPDEVEDEFRYLRRVLASPV